MNHIEMLILHAMAHGIDSKQASDLVHVVDIAERLSSTRYVYVSIHTCPITSGGLRVDGSGPNVVKHSHAWFDFPPNEAPFGAPPPCAYTAIARTGDGELELIQPIRFHGASS